GLCIGVPSELVIHPRETQSAPASVNGKRLFARGAGTLIVAEPIVGESAPPVWTCPCRVERDDRVEGGQGLLVLPGGPLSFAKPAKDFGVERIQHDRLTDGGESSFGAPGDQYRKRAVRFQHSRIAARQVLGSRVLNCCMAEVEKSPLESISERQMGLRKLWRQDDGLLRIGKGLVICLPRGGPGCPL